MSGPSSAPDLDMARPARVARYAVVSTALAMHSDRRLGALVDDAPVTGTGIGGVSTRLDVEGVPVFVKRIPLSDLECRPEHVRSTANLFGLPPYCQYGVGTVGSPGFGAWRELAANTMATNWVLAGQTEAFPLLYHARVLPGAPPVPDEHADVDHAVAYWGGSAAVRARLDATARATTSLVLFLEHLPHPLAGWLAGRLAAGTAAVTAACTMVERRLLADVAFLTDHGLLHFDAHFGNILTDGRRLYFGDLGLATSPRFDLSPAERVFVAHHRTHDAGYTRMRLVNWLVENVCGIAAPAQGGPVARNEFIRRCAAGAEPVGAPPELAAIIVRHAPVAAVMNDFYWDVFGTSRATRYPAEAVDRALAEPR